ncbi:MAG: peptide chain release factor 3 [Planctomycetes bacterium]|nr:peptide chain release factor 3 [Planctomycetota bacterium]
MMDEDFARLQRETARRRTFAIISHPDAGKTTLTEKLLLYSGLLRTAGMVKNRKGGRLATSDWMAMEQERGISITASAMQFEYRGAVINVLDTPGHQDFSADTYRTLTAADAAIMVLDAAKGVEAQTRKLFAACRLRGIPVLSFINKLDLPAREPLSLLAEIEEVLGIQASAINWPTGSGRDFIGVVERATRDLLLFEKTSSGGAQRAALRRLPFASDEARAALGESAHSRLREELEMLDVAGNPFSREAFLAGQVTPVFFGSALTNFGVEPFFDAFIELAPSPQARLALAGDGSLALDPVQAPFSAYVFKIQANMDPRHRDRLSFIRVCSGRFERDMVVKHIRGGRVLRELRLSRPNSLVARERTTIDEAFPGDIVGLINDGFAIGDTLSARAGIAFPELPQFPPEHFARIEPLDLARRKAFDKGMETLAGEGAVLVLRPYEQPLASPFIAAVGRLQFEVLQYRLRDEWGVETRLTPLSYSCSGWLEGDVARFQPTPGCQLARDERGRIAVLFPSAWDREYCLRQNPGHRLLEIA